MGTTSYLAYSRPYAPARIGRLFLPMAAVGIAVVVITLGLSMVTGGQQVDAAASALSEMTAKYHRLRESDFEKDIFPTAQSMTGTDLTGQPLVCGVVVSGVEPGPGGKPVLAWQRAQGTCAGTRLRRPGGAIAIPPEAVAHGATIAVELRTGWPRLGMHDTAGYSIAFSSPTAARLSQIESR